MLTFAELKAKLQISQPKLSAWVRSGLPWHGTAKAKQFDPQEVAEWIVANGKGSRNEPQAEVAAPGGAIETIANTFDQAAGLLGVNKRTLAAWAKLPGFPGRPGSRGRAEGFFPIEAIRAWRAAEYGEATPGMSPLAEARTELTMTRAQLEKLELLRQQGELISLAEVERFFLRVVNGCRALADPLADQVLSLLPAAVDDAARTRIRDRLDQIRDDLFQAWGELMEFQDDPEDQD